MKTIRIVYFAVLKEQSGMSHETRRTDAATCEALYEELKSRHGFTLPSALVRAAVNGAFRDATDPIEDGDEVVFIPPVAGG